MLDEGLDHRAEGVRRPGRGVGGAPDRLDPGVSGPAGGVQRLPRVVVGAVAAGEDEHRAVLDPVEHRGHDLLGVPILERALVGLGQGGEEEVAVERGVPLHRCRLALIALVRGPVDVRAEVVVLAVEAEDVLQGAVGGGGARALLRQRRALEPVCEPPRISAGEEELAVGDFGRGVFADRDGLPHLLKPRGVEVHDGEQLAVTHPRPVGRGVVDADGIQHEAVVGVGLEVGVPRGVEAEAVDLLPAQRRADGPDLVEREHHLAPAFPVDGEAEAVVVRAFLGLVLGGEDDPQRRAGSLLAMQPEAQRVAGAPVVGDLVGLERHALGRHPSHRGGAVLDERRLGGAAPELHGIVAGIDEGLLLGAGGQG